MFGTRLLSLLIGLTIALPGASAPSQADEAENVFDAGQLRTGDDGGIPAGWTLASGDAANVTLMEDDGEPFVRLTGPAKVRTYQLYDAWHPMTVTFKVRASGVKSGDKPWDVPKIDIAAVTTGKYERGQLPTILLQEDTDGWVEMSRTLRGTGTTKGLAFNMTWEGEAGTVDVKDIRGVFEKPKDPEMEGVITPEDDPMIGFSPVARATDASRITGAQIKGTPRVTVHVDQDHPAAHDANPGTANLPFKTIEPALFAARDNHYGFGTPTRVLIQPGVYRLEKPIELIADRGIAERTLLVIEGAEKGEVVISGAQTRGFEPEQWDLIDAEKNIYRVSWPHDFGLVSRGYYSPENQIVHRRHLVVFNGQQLKPRILEHYFYVNPKGVKFDSAGRTVEKGLPKNREHYTFDRVSGPDDLQPGEFGVYELGPGDKAYREHPHANSIVLRLPEGMDSIDGATVEVGLIPTLLRIRGKENLVLRNLVFRHAASHFNNYFDRDAVDIEHTRGAPDKKPRNFLIEGCDFIENGSTGFSIRDSEGVTIRDSRSIRNGFRGWGIQGRNILMEDSASLENGVRAAWSGDGMHGPGGFGFAGFDVLFRNVRSNRNHGLGFRGDVWATNVIYENCQFNQNSNRGMFHEISFGPVLLKDTDLSGNGNDGLFMLNVHDVTLDNCTLLNNGEAAVSLYNSPSRESPPAWGVRGHGGVSNPMNYRFTVQNSTLATNVGPESYLIERTSGVGSHEHYVKLIKEQYTGRDNRFWKASGDNAFEVSTTWGNRAFTDLEGWREFTGEDQSSTWAPPQNVALDEVASAADPDSGQTSMGEGDSANLLPQGEWQGTEPLAGWSFHRDWMKSRFNIRSENGEPFIRVTERAKMTATAALPDAAESIQLRTRIRAAQVKQGEKGWDIPSLMVTFRNPAGEQVGEGGWAHAIKIDADQDWTAVTETYRVPEGATQVDVDISHKGEGVVDIAPLRVTEVNLEAR